MLRFFAPAARRDTARLIPDLADWPGFAGRVAHVLSTPLPAVLAMDWSEMMRWAAVAFDIASERGRPPG
ncbi:hypothetical protein [Azorhizobium caulinodans]|uniref:hypothetical protein n=1 Tax=Azorhizobium caulinodans TaxID=7 RepID=UPI0002E0B386|nr:hypothetical protein [Azorhizobium caulinodans]